MRKIAIIATAAIAVATLTAASSANAAYSIIRWDGTGFCQIWDHNIPTQPFPSNYKTVSTSTLPTFIDALSAKSGMMASGTCRF